MKSFKEFYEKFKVFKGDELLGIYKNPTVDEMKNIPADARGIIIASGDFFIANNNQGFKSLHAFMSDRAILLYGVKNEINKALEANPKKLKNGITLQRVGKTNMFAIGETDGFIFDGDFIVDQKKIKIDLKKLFTSAKKKNPKLKFLAKDIMEFE